MFVCFLFFRDLKTSLQQGIGGSGRRGRDKERYTTSETERKRKGKQDCEIDIIAYTNEKLITPQLAVQTVLLEAERRGQHAASVKLRGIWGFVADRMNHIQKLWMTINS